MNEEGNQCYNGKHEIKFNEDDLMKNITLLLVSILCMLPIIVSAHTTISSSTPTEGQIITEELTELKVEFAGEIEKRSTLILKKDNNEMALSTITVDEKSLIGTLSTPLSNGNYVLTWSIAAKDGHVMTGDIPFSVELAETEEAPSRNEGETENEAIVEDTEADDEPMVADQQENTLKSSETSNNSSNFATISVIVLIILLSGGIWILFRKKR